MATYDPVYRLTVFDRDGVTVLTPAAGAPHSDDFKLATASGVTGFFPYLETPRGRRGRIDPIRRKPDTGLVTFRSLDPRTTANGSNLSRFITAFMGDENGREQLGGLKCLIERSTDGAAGTFSDWYTGLIQTVDSDGRLWFSFQVRDMSEALNHRIFMGVPPASVTYVSPTGMLPVGLAGNYGGAVLVPPLVGTMVASSDADGPLNALTIVPQPLSIATQAFVDLLVDRTSAPRRRSVFLRVRADVLDGPNAGSSGHWLIRGIRPNSTDETPRRVKVLYVEALQDAQGNLLTGDPDYLAMEGAGVTIQFHVIHTGEPDEVKPLYIDSIHPATLLKDILDGNFGRLSGGLGESETFGDTTWSVPYSSSDFTSFIADTTFGFFRGIITEVAGDARAWIERHIMLPYGLGYYYDESGDFRLIDMRRVAASGSPSSFTTADLVDGATPSKRFRRTDAVTRVDAFYYMDVEVDRSDVINSPDKYPVVPPSLIRSYKLPLIILNFADTALPEKTLTIDAVGSHGFFDDWFQGFYHHAKIRQDLMRQMEELKGPFIAGSTIHSAEVNLAAGALSGMSQGDLRIWDFDEVADPATNLRGGQRLVRITEISPGAIGVVVTAVDLGEDSVAVGPVLAAISALSGSEGIAINVPVTVNAAGEPVQIEYNTTATSVGTRPAEADPDWIYADTVYGTGTLVVTDLPSGLRVWVRGRSLPQDSAALKIPSGWVFPSGTGRVDLTGLATPNTPTISEITGTTALVSWTNTEDAFDIEIHLKQGGDQIRVARLINGSKEFLLEFLDNSTTYTAIINYRDFARGGTSAEATSSPFVTTATDPTCPTIDGLVILAGRPA